ncbi:uncharacterized protein PADG_11617 [Paracoccidioides brasiliensis Pb18]|uniref:Uncharacterized protein n=2 Tax=Paracoccidioides brasiliensis TaxID=121759 RepID=A0A0A0HTW9_PARBD|nr:uncharacterized protein PADG_11617 [Paracoccidioides brasiliensis Pb18]KGM92087.1 hypothetical protein PADG_11617 [Paracoccidioides brasiliensis Pb18]ODH44299.1 hypothetical protein ACO22_00919 [Paracoccidioides brasiliensis]
MAKTPSSSPSLLKQFSNYTNSGLGLENFLRLIQSICQVVSVTIASAAESEPWTIAWKNLALKKYFPNCLTGNLINNSSSSQAAATSVTSNSSTVLNEPGLCYGAKMHHLLAGTCYGQLRWENGAV